MIIHGDKLTKTKEELILKQKLETRFPYKYYYRKNYRDLLN